MQLTATLPSRNQQLCEFISGLAITEKLMAELLDAELLQKHRLYIELTSFLTPCYPAIPQDQLDALVGNSYLYFRFLLQIDGLIDGDTSTANSAAVLFTSLSLHEQAVCGLARLFPTDSSFWVGFEVCKKEYATANAQEKQLNSNPHEFTEKRYEEIAAGKSAVCYALAYALDALSGSRHQHSHVWQCLREMHVAMQYRDDVEDFKKDWLAGQFTYARHLVAAHLLSKGLDTDTVSASDAHKHFYTSGAAHVLLTKCVEHYHKSIALAKDLELTEMVNFLLTQVNKCNVFLQEVSWLLEKTSAKAQKSAVLLYDEPPTLTKDTLRQGIGQALTYLQRNQDAQGCWEDFLTSAGQSRLWATAYAGLQLAETSSGLALAQEVFAASQHLPASYNSSILQDGDSTTFGMGLRRKIGEETDARQLSAWLAFMNEDGGWVTYRDAARLRERLELPQYVGVEAWLTVKTCVTAAAAYALSLYGPSLNVPYQRSCAYLLRTQQPDGHWESYWWTSPIYATAFAVLALRSTPAYDTPCTMARRWLVAQQQTDGAWYNPNDNRPNAFYTALALQALSGSPLVAHQQAACAGARWLLHHQTTDGSWQTSRILRIPATDVYNPALVENWRQSSFGVNVVVDDHQRIFTTSTALNALHSVTYLN